MNYPSPLIGGLLRAGREDNGWTRDEMRLAIAKHPRLGPKYLVSTRTISRAEQGHFVDLRTRFALATVLGKVPSDIWVEKPVRKRPAQPRKAVAA
jgi:hypothetical protein